jgi:diadenosine tetraphosphate (Ap4A) HIT family hydrolase
MSETRAVLLRDDSSISGFNVGVNSGSVAGQTVMHCHIHLIARREGEPPILGEVCAPSFLGRRTIKEELRVTVPET